MAVIDELIDYGMKLDTGLRVQDVRIGLGYTAVQIEGGEVGLAYTFRGEAGHTCTAVKMAGELAGKPVGHLLAFMKEGDVVSAAVGLATFNALLQRRLPTPEGEDFFPIIQLQAGETVGMVGFFGPVIPLIRKARCELRIFEKNLARGEGLFSPEKIPQKLPECSVVILSATTLINRTFEEVVAYTREARHVVLLGPSTPLVPEVMGRYGVTLLAGMKIVRPAAVLRIVSEGGGTQRLRGTVEKMVVSCKKAG